MVLEWVNSVDAFQSKLTVLEALSSEFQGASENIMKTYSSDNMKMKIECFIDSALKNEMSRDILAAIVDSMTPTLDKSKEVIKILLEIICD